MNGGGNPSVGGGGFAASPAGTAPLYYKSAEIASGSAKNLCKKSEDVGGCALRGTGSTCRCGKLNGGACPGVAGAAGVSDTRRGACPVGRPPTLPLACFPAPYPPDPLPRWGRGRPKVYFAGGFAPGTPAFNRLRHSQSLPSRYPAAEIRVCRKTDRKRFPMSSAGSQGEGGPGEMELSVASDGGV